MMIYEPEYTSQTPGTTIVEQPQTQGFLGEFTGLIIVGAFLYLFMPVLKTLVGKADSKLKG